MGKQAAGTGRRTPAAARNTDADDLAIVPTCDFGYDIPSDFEDEEIDEANAFESDESDDVDHEFVTSSSRDAVDQDQIEGELRRESKRTGLKLLDLSDLISSDDDNESPTATALPQDSHAGDDNHADSDDEQVSPESLSDGDDDEQLSDAGEDGEDDDGDDPEAHAAVLSVIDQLSRRDDARLRRKADQLLQQADETVPAPVSGAQPLTLDELLNPIQTAGSAFGDVKSTFERFASDAKSKVADVRLETADRRRLERSAGLQRTRAEMDKWAHLVQANRRADHLTFPLNQERYSESSATLVAKFRPTNSLEQDLKELTQLYRQTERQLSRGEQLEENVLGTEELERRQAQIAKMRSLLFYHELRAKRIKKIKSKAFRKHLKKATSRPADDDLEQVCILETEEERL